MDKQIAFEISGLPVTELQPEDSIAIDFENKKCTIRRNGVLQEKDLTDEELSRYAAQAEYEKEPDVTQKDLLTVISIVVTIVGILVSCVGFVWQGNKKCRQMRRVTKTRTTTKYSNGTTHVETTEEEEYWDQC